MARSTLAAALSSAMAIPRDRLKEMGIPRDRLKEMGMKGRAWMGRDFS